VFLIIIIPGSSSVNTGTFEHKNIVSFVIKIVFELNCSLIY